MTELFTYFMAISIVDFRIPADIEAALIREGFSVIKTEPYERLSAPLSGHPDMIFSKIGNSLFTPRDYFLGHRALIDKIKAKAPSLRIITTEDLPSSEYPNDAKMNILTKGGALFLNPRSASPELISYAKTAGLRIYSARQGYPACTSLIVGNSAITADRGMARLFSSAGLGTLIIENGGISLPPYPYGFIGGASGIHRNRVYFIGNLDSHPDAGKIREVCENEGFLPISLGTSILLDLGGIIFI